MHFTPVHCSWMNQVEQWFSWMNQVEQWFSILQRKRLTAPNFPDLHALEHWLTKPMATFSAENVAIGLLGVAQSQPPISPGCLR